jgi:hypothetical protein
MRHFVDTPGEEHGYVVRLTDDTLDPPYMLNPNQDITIVATYNSTIDHFGEPAKCKGCMGSQ